MIEVNTVTKRFSKKIAVDRISFHVSKGEILGFLGPNGAGKTTTMRMITGSLSTTEGSIQVAGYDILTHPSEAKRLIGYLPEIPPLYLDMGVAEYLRFVGRIKELPRQRIHSRLDYVFNACTIGDVKKRIIKNLSKGFKQRVGIAAALIHDPQILILDEPTIGLDPKQIIEIRNLIKSLSREHTVVLSTHILPEVTMTCSKVIIINKGKIVAENKTTELEGLLENTNRIRVGIKSPPQNHADIVSKMEQIRGIHRCYSENHNTFIVESSREEDPRETIAKMVVKNGWGLLELRLEQLNLEDIFLKLTQ